MGGREVGGLASTLAAHMGFEAENVATVGRFWASPGMATKPGLKAVDLFRAVGEGQIKALWIMATNPAVSMADAGRIRDALAACPFVVVSDVMAQTDTSAYAHVRLPAAAWGEKDGTVTHSKRCVSRQRALLSLPGEVRPDWWIIKEIARRMGWASAFAYDHPADIWREHARLTAYRNGGRRLLDLRAHAAISNESYDSLVPFRWGEMPFASGRFPTADGRARLIAVRQAPMTVPPPRFPYTLNTGRYRDQWHTMTRTGLSPKLTRHRAEPQVEVHPARHGIPVRICPGVTAASAAAAGVSLTLRGLARKLTLLTAHARAGEPLNLDSRSLAAPDATLAIYMGRGAADEIARHLIAAGRAPETPVLVAVDVSLPGERIIRGTLGTLSFLVRTVASNDPTLLLIGEAVSAEHLSLPEPACMRDATSHSWFEVGGTPAKILCMRC